jgi:alpha-glucosidase
VAAQIGDPDSTLQLYRSALRLRRERLVAAGPLAWLDTPPGTLAFGRGSLTCWLNTSDHSVALPGGRLLLGSVPGMDDRSLPVDAAAWVDTT